MSMPKPTAGISLRRVVIVVSSSVMMIFPPLAGAGDWPTRLEARLTEIDRQYAGEIGVHVRRPATDERLGHRDAERWYWASLVKIPVAVELLDRVSRGDIDLQERMTLAQSDYVDGAGATNWAEPGSEIRLRTLLKRMLIQSDNTATDMLIRRVGLDAVNRRARRLMGDGIGPITTLVDVRRHLYAAFTDQAWSLSGLELIDLRQSAFGEPRLARLAQLTGVSRRDFPLDELAAGYERYYATGLNSGRLDRYADMLARINAGKALDGEATQVLLEIMRRATTGHARLAAGFQREWPFAQKTGTQHARFCDAGIVNPRTSRAVIIVSCLKGDPSRQNANRTFQAIGEAIEASGVLDGGSSDQPLTGTTF